MKTNSVERKYVMPGDVVIEGDHNPIANVIKSGNKIISTKIGMAEIAYNGVRVIPLNGTYIPRIDDVVIGKVADMNGFAWEVDINSWFFGILTGSAVFGRQFSSSRDSMKSQFNKGECLIAKILSFDRTRDPLISVSGPGLGKIKEGEIAYITSSKIPRVIGKKGAMIKLIEENTGCRMTIGQNGAILLKGTDEARTKARNAIKLIGNQAHTSDLNDKVINLISK